MISARTKTAAALLFSLSAIVIPAARAQSEGWILGPGSRNGNGNTVLSRQQADVTATPTALQSQTLQLFPTFSKRSPTVLGALGPLGPPTREDQLLT